MFNEELDETGHEKQLGAQTSAQTKWKLLYLNFFRIVEIISCV